MDAFSESSSVWGGTFVQIKPGDTSADYAIKGLAPASDYRVHISSPTLVGGFYAGEVDGTEDAITADFFGATLLNPEKLDVNPKDGTSDNGIDFSISGGNTISGTITLPSAANNPRGFVDVFVNAHSRSQFFGNGVPVQKRMDRVVLPTP